ncbi:MAG: hypothetical protein ABI878_03165 [Acidobacteriota bacterium]
MRLPVSFDNVSYFQNEYRGDLIVTKGIVYYFPHTRVAASHSAPELGGKGVAETVGFIGSFLRPAVGLAPLLHTAADKSIKIGKFFGRIFLPKMNSPRIRNIDLWSGRELDEALQKNLDDYIEKTRKTKLAFGDDAVPKPIRFAVADMQNVRVKLKLRFDAGYDHHDFRVSPFVLGKLKLALRHGGFIP